MMGESTFQTWWELHVRVARGESLTAEESAFYDSHRHDLETGEQSQLVLGAKHARDDLTALESERSQLEQRRQELDAEIRLLESRMGEETRRLLGVEK
jgi:hypothetical protein